MIDESCVRILSAKTSPVTPVSQFQNPRNILVKLEHFHDYEEDCFLETRDHLCVLLTQSLPPHESIVSTIHLSFARLSFTVASF